MTAAFNRNLLVRINRELGADFDPAAFRHRAFYNAATGRGSRCTSSARRDQTVRVGGRGVRLPAGESIHTENSYKYALAEFERLAAGLVCGL